jgi:hypothetical protein
MPLSIKSLSNLPGSLAPVKMDCRRRNAMVVLLQSEFDEEHGRRKITPPGAEPTELLQVMMRRS